MSSEGVRAAAAAWMRVNQAVYDEERKKIVEKFKDGSKPWFHLDAPLTMSRQEYKDFISRELEGIKVSWAFIEGLGLFVGRDRSALIDGAREYLATTFPGARENPPGVFVINARSPVPAPNSVIRDIYREAGKDIVHTGDFQMFRANKNEDGSYSKFTTVKVPNTRRHRQTRKHG